MPDKWPPPDAQLPDSRGTLGFEQKENLELKNLKEQMEWVGKFVNRPEVNPVLRNDTMKLMVEFSNEMDRIGDLRFGPENPRPEQVFLSYSRLDAETAAGFESAFDDLDVRLWRDTNSVVQDPDQREAHAAQSNYDSPKIFPLPGENKYVADSSDIVLLLTENSVNRFDQIERELVDFYHAGREERGIRLMPRQVLGDQRRNVIPVIMGDAKAEKRIETVLKKKHHGQITGEKAIHWENAKDVSGLAFAVLKKIQEKMKEKGAFVPQDTIGRSGKNIKAWENMRAMGNHQGSRGAEAQEVLPVFDKAFASLNAVKARCAQNPEAIKTAYPELAEIQKNIEQAIDQWFENFKPRKVFLGFSPSGGSLAGDMKKLFVDSIKIEVDENAEHAIESRKEGERSYGIFVIDSQDLEKGFPDGLQGDMRTFVGKAFGRDDYGAHTEIVPIYRGINDSRAIMAMLEKNGDMSLHDFGTFTGIFTHPQDTPESLIRKTLLFMKRSERAEIAGRLYGKKFNAGLDSRAGEDFFL